MPIKLREALLCSYMLLNSKAWSDLKESQIDKMEVVKQSLLCSLVEARSNVFLYLEVGILTLRHLIMIRRMTYHHQIL